MPIVQFNADVVPAPNLQVFIDDDDELPTSGGHVVTTKKYNTHTVMSVVFRVSGPNGTKFKITYSCSSDGKDSNDTNQPSPVSSQITNGGVKQIELKIPV